MRNGLRITLILFGLICAVIAAGHIAIGQRAIPGGVVTNATMDSEDRFFATLFLCFGLAVIWCARDLGGRDGMLRALLAAFFAGGIARLVSLVAVGPPSGLFLFLGALELALPPLFWWWLVATRARPR
ncbi:MAG: DUF4345 domain-containing protein [Sphingomonas sp.]